MTSGSSNNVQHPTTTTKQTEVKPSHTEPAKGTQGSEVPSTVHVFSPPIRQEKVKSYFTMQKMVAQAKPIYHITATMLFDCF